MRVAIVGSRDYPDLDQVVQFVRGLPSDTVVVSGGARGVDRTAEQTARACGLRTLIFPADWTRHGKRAGFLRNDQILAAAEEVVAFWDGRSPGTADTIRKARRAGKRVKVFGPHSGSSHYAGLEMPRRLSCTS
jgi:hypothetical protein